MARHLRLRAAIILAVCCLRTGTAGADEGIWFTPEVLTPEIQLVSIRAVDLNGDGVPDLVGSAYANKLILAFLGCGDGTFEPRLTDLGGTGAPSSHFDCADFNNDGFVDLVLATDQHSAPPVFFGVGDGTFEEGQVIGPPFPRCVATGDFDGDGNVDVVYATPARLSVILGDGQGAFGATIETEAQLFAVVDVCVADFNSDGTNDVALASSSIDAVVVMLGLGNGQFSQPTYISVGEEPVSIAACDVDEDGDVDLVVANHDAGTASVLANDGTSQFQVATTFAVGAGASGVAVGELTGDDFLDVVSISESTGTIAILPGAGRGAFNAPILQESYRSQFALSVGDFNGDGADDLATVTNSSPETLTVYLRPLGAMLTPVQEITCCGSPREQKLGDVNNDGLLDVVVPAFSGAAVFVLLGAEGGQLGPPIHSHAGNAPSGLALIDLDEDGNLDLVVANIDYGANKLSILRGHGDGRFQFPTAMPLGDVPFDFATADFDADGDIDLIAHMSDSDGSVARIRNNGDGSLTLVGLTDVPSPIRSIDVADINGDGAPDFAVGAASSVSVYFGNGDLTFAAGPVNSTPSATDIRLGHLNDDDVVDFAIVPSAGDSVRVYLGNGDGTFAFQSSASTRSGARDPRIFDLNDDGLNEIIVTSGSAESFSVHQVDALGNVGPDRSYATGLNPVAVAAGKIDNDEWPDLVVTNSGSNSVQVFISRLDPVCVADLTGDGIVNGADLASLLSQWENSAVADLNGDGVVNGADLSQLLATWGKCP